MTSASTLSWKRQGDGSWTAADGRFRAARLSGARWALEDSHRGTGSVLERTVGVFPSLRDARGAAQSILENDRPKHIRGRRRR